TYRGMDELLADARVDIVVSLTPPATHGDVVEQCLSAGKHVYTEKPMTLDPAQAFALVDLAEQRGLRLASAPATFMGEAQQTAMKVVRDGGVGTVRVVYAEANGGMLESWHPEPWPFYEIGPLYDLGPYPLTIATSLFGPAIRVISYARLVKPHRRASS